MVALAGAASAQSTAITLKGSAEIGAFGGDTISNTSGAVTARSGQFHTDVDVTFQLRGTTDNGLEFGANVDLDEAAIDACTIPNPLPAPPAAPVACVDNATNNDAAHGGVDFFIKGAFGTVSMGDVDGALDWAMAEVPAGGSIDDAQEGAGWNGNGGLDGIYDGQILRYDNTFGAFGVGVSVEVDDAAVNRRDPAYGLGLKYTLDLGGNALNLGLGYQRGERTAGVSDTVTGLSVGTTFGNVGVGLNYSIQARAGVATDIKHIGVGASYTMDAITLAANYGKYTDGVMGSNPTFSAGHEASHFGLTAAYALGGGATAQFGWSKSDVTLAGGASTSASRWSLGVAMSF